MSFRVASFSAPSASDIRRTRHQRCNASNGLQPLVLVQPVFPVAVASIVPSPSLDWRWTKIAPGACDAPWAPAWNASREAWYRSRPRGSSGWLHLVGNDWQAWGAAAI